MPVPLRSATIGQRFGRLVVVGFTRKPKKSAVYTYAVCQCDCGEIAHRIPSYLKNHKNTSCGCEMKKIKHTTTHGACKGGRSTPEYNIWRGMIKRCCLPSDKDYYRYGAVGISVCKEWLASFEAFLADMGPKPAGKSLDRWPNPSGGYSPGNCRWATVDEQNRNRKDNVFVEHNGVSLCLTDWERGLGFLSGTLGRRIDSGWTIEKALTTPVAYRSHAKRHNASKNFP